MSPPSPEERRTLLSLARRSIGDTLDGRRVEALEGAQGMLSEMRGAFVTLKLDGRLRGCIGRVESDMPLWETVSRMARASAFEDPRFPPLEAEELERVSIEISVLTVPRRIDPEAIVVGRDGLIVERGHNKGLLLPQVASEWGWDRTEFLDQTCVKAGLPPGVWRESETAVYAFTADVFSE